MPLLIFWLALGTLVYWLATTVFSVLGARVHFEVRRHNLLVRSKQLRLEYLNSIDDRLAGVVEDEDVIEPLDEAQAEEPLANAA